MAASGLRRATFGRNWTSGVVAGLRSPFFFMAAASVIILRFTPATSAIVTDVGVSALQVVVFVGFCGLLAAAYNAIQSPVVWRWENEKLEERISNFVDLMSLAESSVILITGSCNRTLFDDDRVLRALRNLNAGVAISLYHEAPFLDPGSQRFVHELMRRGCVFTQIVPGQICHGAVVDELHCKIEQFGVDDGAAEKHVEYFAFDPWRARKAIEDIAGLKKATPAPLAA